MKKMKMFFEFCLLVLINILVKSEKHSTVVKSKVTPECVIDFIVSKQGYCIYINQKGKICFKDTLHNGPIVRLASFVDMDFAIIMKPE